LAHHAIRLSSAGRSPDGRLGNPTRATVTPQNRGPATPEDIPKSLLAACSRDLVDIWNRQPTPILRAPDRPVVVILELSPQPFPRASSFSDHTQLLTLDVVLKNGDSVPLVIQHGPGTRRLIAVLEQHAHWLAPPTHLLVRLNRSQHGFSGIPISAWLQGKLGPISLSLGDSPLSPTLRTSPNRIQRSPRSSPRRALQTIHSLLDLLESLSIEGIERGLSWRKDALITQANDLAQCGFDAAASGLIYLTKEDKNSRLTIFIKILSWAYGVEEQMAFDKILQKIPQNQ